MFRLYHLSLCRPRFMLTSSLAILPLSLLMVACLQNREPIDNSTPNPAAKDTNNPATPACDPATQTCPGTAPGTPTTPPLDQTSFSYVIHKNGSHQDPEFLKALTEHTRTLHAHMGSPTSWEVQITLTTSGPLRTHLVGLYSERDPNKEIPEFACTYDTSKHQYACTNTFVADGTAHMRVKAMDVGHCKEVNAANTSACDADNWHSTLTNNAFITLNIPVTVHRVTETKT